MVLLFCIAFAIIAAVAGCSGNDAQPEETNAPPSNQGTSGSGESGESNAAANEGKYGDTLQIKFLGWNNQGFLPKDDTPVKRELEKLFNLEIENVKVDVYNKEQLNVYLASGEKPDFMYMGYDPEALYNSGLIRDIPFELLEQYAPVIVESLNEQMPREEWAQFHTFDGKLYGIPEFSITRKTPVALGIRKDWMDAVGVTDIPGTMTELEDLFIKFRNNDPDGNGVKDTYALSKWEPSPESYRNLAPYIFGAYGLKQYHWHEMDGELIWWAVHPEYKNALKKLNEWYEKEIFDPEVVLDDRAKFISKFENDKLAGFFDLDAWHDPGQQAGPVAKLLAKRPNVEMVYIPPVTGESGLAGSYNSSIISRTAGTYFGADTSDEKMIRLLQMLNEIYSNEDLYALVVLGFEGEDYTINEKGEYIRMEGRFTSEAMTDRGTERYYMHNFLHDMALKFRLSPSRLTVNKQIADFAVVDAPSVQPSISSEYAAGLNKIEQEFLWKALVGQIDVEKEWDGYVAQWMAAGGQDATTKANEEFNSKN